MLRRRCRRYNAGLKREIDAVIASQLERDDPRPPSIFMSLSCAEFYWKPMLTYLAKHIEVVEGKHPGDLLQEENSSVRFVKLQEYAHVVTLYFEQRAKEFIKTVLMPVLGIEIFYAVCEFADGRGQIHIHLVFRLL